MTVGDRLKLRRTQLGITQEELAETLGTNHKQIWKYERDRNKPSSDVIIALANALETTSDWILGLSEDIQPMGDESNLAPSEQVLLRLYRSKTPDKQQQTLDIVRAI
jgi:transcriptional regulator with XRE-family HTH domain